MFRGTVPALSRSSVLAGLARLRRRGPVAGMARRYVGDHEAEIDRLFDGRTALAPGSYGGRMLVVVGFTNRCGSNLTANLMVKSHLTTSALESLNAAWVRQSGAEKGHRDVQAYMDWLTSVGRIDAPFAIKASPNQLAMLLRWGAAEAFGAVRVVHVVREDLLGQAVSYSIAAQTGRWTSAQPGLDVEPAFDPADILRRLDAIASANARMVEVCRIAELPLLRVAYEDMVATPLRQLGRIAAFLGRDLMPDAAPRPDITKQANAMNDAFVDRFRAWARAAGRLEARRPDEGRGP